MVKKFCESLYKKSLYGSHLDLDLDLDLDLGEFTKIEDLELYST